MKITLESHDVTRIIAKYFNIPAENATLVVRTISDSQLEVDILDVPLPPPEAPTPVETLTPNPTRQHFITGMAVVPKDPNAITAWPPREPGDADDGAIHPSDILRQSRAIEEELNQNRLRNSKKE